MSRLSRFRFKQKSCVMVYLNGVPITRFIQTPKHEELNQALQFATQLHQLLTEGHVIKVYDLNKVEVLNLIKNENDS